jgi:hypothetical protein
MSCPTSRLKTPENRRHGWLQRLVKFVVAATSERDKTSTASVKNDSGPSIGWIDIILAEIVRFAARVWQVRNLLIPWVDDPRGMGSVCRQASAGFGSRGSPPATSLLFPPAALAIGTRRRAPTSLPRLNARVETEMMMFMPKWRS